MGIGQYKEKFNNCEHDWILHIDTDSSDRMSNSLLLCNKCGTLVTMLERNSLNSLKLQEKSIRESLASQKESQEIQEKNIKISMWANIIASATMLIAFMVLLFGDSLFK